jgi:hypothetical protein
MSQTIEYPFTKDYVKHWGVWEAVRELIQNAIDSKDFDYHYSQVEQKLVITNDGGFNPKCFLFGVSEKTGVDPIGSFGEGMKLALLVLARENLYVSIKSGKNLYDVDFGHSEVFNADVMRLHISELVEPVVRTIVKITMSEGLYLTFSDKILDDKSPRVIREDPVGRIFVGGLYVTTLPNMKYSYNFSPSSIKLNRDRDIPSMYDIQCAASDLLNDSELVDIHLEGAAEASHYVGAVRIAKGFRMRFPDVVPIGVSEQNKIVPADKTKKIMVVSDFLANLVRRLYKMAVAFKNYATPASRLEKWLESWSNYVPENAVGEMRSIIKELKGEHP